MLQLVQGLHLMCPLQIQFSCREVISMMRIIFREPDSHFDVSLVVWLHDDIYLNSKM